MLEWIVLIVLILAAAILLLFMGSVFQFLINIAFIVTLAILIYRDINKRNMLKYYLISTIAAVIVLIFPTFHFMINFLKKAYLIELTQALLLIYLFAYLSNYLYEEYHKILIDLKKRQKSKKS